MIYIWYSWSTHFSPFLEVRIMSAGACDQTVRFTIAGSKFADGALEWNYRGVFLPDTETAIGLITSQKRNYTGQFGQQFET